MRRVQELTRLGEKEVTDHTVAIEFSVSDQSIYLGAVPLGCINTHAILYGMVSLKPRRMGLRQQKAISGAFDPAHGDHLSRLSSTYKPRLELRLRSMTANMKLPDNHGRSEIRR
jgi:hypothetical protein